MNKEPTSDKIVVLAAAVVLLLVAAFSLYRSDRGAPAQQTYVQEDTVILEDTVATEGMLRVPPGFPASIPVEEDTLLEGFKATYLNRNLTRFSLKYSSTSSVENEWEKYQEFMLSQGYTLSSTANVLGGIGLYGAMSDNALSVRISQEDEQTVVRLNYYEM